MKLRITGLAALLTVLAACGGGGSTATTTSTAASGSVSSDGASESGSAVASAEASGSASASSAAPTPLGPAVPAATTVAKAVPAAELPTATGTFGQKPTLTFPTTNPPASLQRRILTEGTGPVTASGDFLQVNYLGQIWGGKVFDNSYDRKTTFSFQTGPAGKVVSGWANGMVGVKVGSRVLLSLPPSSGYTSTGNADAGIKGTDTIVFVIDVVKDIPSTATGQTDAVVQALPAGLPTVTGALGHEPTITVPKGLAQPSKNTTQILAKGTGAPVKAGNVLVQLVVTDWTQTQTSSTWPAALAASSGAAPSSAAAAAGGETKGLQEIPVSTTDPTSGLVGVPLGSRVLLLVAPSTDSSTGQASAAAVAVIDLVAQSS